MQMAMVLTGQKPTQRARIGECSEGSAGVHEERGDAACAERRTEKRRELERPWGFLGETGRRLQAQEGALKTSRESDQPIVL
jgi:hypothetical protein